MTQLTNIYPTISHQLSLSFQSMGFSPFHRYPPVLFSQLLDHTSHLQIYLSYFKSQYNLNMKVTEIVTTRTLTGETHTTSNSYVAGNRSYINSGFTPESNLLRQSQIINLPNHRKMGLGDNLPMVVVFQTIEIERLSTEVESLRIKIKDFERQIFNAQNYEVQIRELTEKLFSYEHERETHMSEIEKLNVICHQLYTELEDMKRKYAEVDLTLREKYEFEKSRNAEFVNEIERWKARYMASEKSKQKELDDLRLMMESQRKSMLDREMRELTLRFQTERGNLENEIRKLRENLEYKNRELDDAKRRLKEFEVTILELKRHESTIRELESKLTMITQEMHRLNELLRQKQDELEAGRQKEFKLQQQMKEQSQWEVENKQLKNTLENRLREIEDWKVRASKLEAELDKGREVARNNQQLTIKITTAGREIERLNDVLRGKLDEIEQWKQRLSRQETETARYKNLEGDIKTYENKIMTLTGEIERLNGVMKNRLLEAEEWKNKCSKLEVSITNYQVVEKNNKDLEGRLKDNIRMIEDLKGKIGKSELEINNYKMLEGRLNDSERKEGLYKVEIDRINTVIKSKIQENDDFRVRYSNLESKLIEYKSIEGKVREYENANNLLTRQLEEYSNEIRVKTDEADRYKGIVRKLEEEVEFLRSHEIKLKDNERNIHSLQTTITEIKRTLLTEQDKTRGFENRIREMEQTIFALTQEKERLQGSGKQRVMEYEELRSRYARLEQENMMLRETEEGLRVVKNQLMMVGSEKERLEKVLFDMEAELGRERGLSNDLGARVIVLCAEIERAQSGSGMKSKEFKEFQERFYSLETMCKTKDGEIMVLTQKIENFEKKITFITSELERFVQLVTQQEQKARVLEQEITQFQDYARRIQILSAEIDRLQGENRGLEEDLQKLRLKYADNIAMDLKMENICVSFVLLMVEVESLRGRLSEREVQFEEMRKSILNPVRNI